VALKKLDIPSAPTAMEIKYNAGNRTPEEEI